MGNSLGCGACFGRRPRGAPALMAPCSKTPAVAPTAVIVITPSDMNAYIDDIVNAAPANAADPTPATKEPPKLEAALLAATRQEDFSLEGRRFLAKVVDVYDGDTLRVIINVGVPLSLTQFRARMAGYDSPEMKPSVNDPKRDAEKAAALAAKNALIHKIGNDLVYIRCGKFDKYGRLLIVMFTRGVDGADGENINEWMIANGHGYPYDGGTKRPFGKLTPAAIAAAATITADD